MLVFYDGYFDTLTILSVLTGELGTENRILVSFRLSPIACMHVAKEHYQ